MRIFLTLLLLFGVAQSDMVIPITKHDKQEHTTTTVTDTVTHSCPEGYEGHYVDIQPGFENDYWLSSGAIMGWGSGFGGGSFGVPAEQEFTICFKKDFMDKVRKNPDLVGFKPSPPRGV